jgi:hypothetical protein
MTARDYSDMSRDELLAELQDLLTELGAKELRLYELTGEIMTASEGMKEAAALLDQHQA